METNKIVLPQEIYCDHLESVNNVRLTRREIDIVAYLCGGRSAKTISSFLSITPKTIEAHMRNIMTKLECNSRDGIIDFIEKSDKFLFIKKYYVSLLAQACFERQLLKAAQLIKPKNPSCLLIYWQNEKQSLLIVRTLEHHLKLAGIEVLSDPQGDSKFILNLTNDIEYWQTNHALCCFPYALFKELQENGSNQQEDILKSLRKISENPKSIITIFSEKGCKEDLEQEYQKINYINYSDQESFYSYVFLVLKKLLPDINLDDIILEFNNQCEAIYGSTQEPNSSVPVEANVIRAGSLMAKTLSLFHSLSPTWKNRRVRFLIEGGTLPWSFLDRLYNPYT